MDDKDIFAAAMSDEPAPVQADAAPAEQQSPETPSEPTQDGPARDERGRFASTQPDQASAEAKPAEGETRPEGEAKPEDAQKPQQQDNRVPVAELVSERKRFQQQIEDERKAREEDRRQLAALQRQLADMQRKGEQPAPQKAPDFFEDPVGALESVRNEMRQQLRMQEGEFALRLAKRQYGQEFDAAYEALIKTGESGDHAAVQAILGKSDPGEALIRWHRQQSLMEKTGGDLDAFLKKREDELLNDPGFMQKIAEKLRSQNGQVQSGARPAPIVELPPSLSKVPSAAPVTDDPVDMSDAGLFRHAMGR